MNAIHETHKSNTAQGIAEQTKSHKTTAPPMTEEEVISRARELAAHEGYDLRPYNYYSVDSTEIGWEVSFWPDPPLKSFSPNSPAQGIMVVMEKPSGKLVKIWMFQ